MTLLLYCPFLSMASDHKALAEKGASDIFRPYNIQYQVHDFWLLVLLLACYSELCQNKRTSPGYVGGIHFGRVEFSFCFCRRLLLAAESVRIVGFVVGKQKIDTIPIKQIHCY